ncbi:protein kinase domain-containing protein [Sorangium sp. So ce542]|uniref:serine/threonine protein kinase n=1 Tax=Sorangium sp. So ce542 TaxID=3133316 RepID=UPI003F639BCB
MALPNKAKIPVGTVLAGKYRITREIGRGGMAAVYEAEHIDIGKRVAIKVLAQELTTSAVVVERFLREARAAASIRSPFICDVYDSGKLDDGRPFLVLELLEGESLYERMTVVRYLDPETTVTVVSQVCRGLTKAHAASIVHRDLKPENIFLTKDEEGRLCAKILDFGLAKFYAPVDGGDAQARLTREGAVFGTPAYMSPEQVRGQGAVDHRADLWALGCITYECLTGRTVWQTEQGVAMTFAQIANAPLPQPSALRPDLPPSFTVWFEKALDRSIDRRFQTAKEFADELSIALGVAQPTPPRGAEPSQAGLLPTGGDPPADVTFDPPGVVRVTPNEARRTVPSGPAERGLDPFAGLDFSSLPGGAPAGRVSQGAGQQITFSGGSGEASVSDPLAQRSPPRRGGAGRALVVFGVLVLAAGAAYAGYRQFLKPTALPPVSSSAAPPPVVSAPSSSASAAAVPARADAQAEPAGLQWPPLVAQAQESIAAGDLKAALRLLRDAQEKGNHPVPRTLIEHLQVALKDASGKAPCQLTGLARPRTHDLVREGGRAIGASRPSISLGPRGAVITWTDSHEGTEHAYTAALDSAMRPSSPALDVTPEGRAIGRPELTTAGDRLVLTYWDGKGPEAGVYVRWLDASGRIDGPAMMVARFPRGGNSWPSLARAPEGFVIAWSDDGDNASSEDLFLRRLSPNLDPVGEIIRLTDVTPTGPSKPRVRLPSIAVTSDVMHLAFRFDRDPMRVIQYMRLPLASADKGLPPAAPGKRADRALGELSLVNSDRARSDSPSLACGAAGCFVVWHGEAPIGGASAAYIDPAKGQPLWRKRFSKTGARPSIAIAPSGQAQLVWFEQGRMLTASINRDGIGAPTKFARVSGDQPAPAISPGAKPGEWYVAWLDYEAGHLEPYAARIQCR